MTTTIIENSSVTLLARVLDAHGQPISKSSIVSITAKVFNADSGEEVTPAPSIEVADAIHDTLQTDSRWTVDSTGFNFETALGGAYFPEAGSYRVEVKLIPDDGLSFYIAFDLNAVNILSE